MVLVYNEADVSAKGVSLRMAQLFVTWFCIRWCIVVWCTPCSYTEVCNQPARKTYFVYFSIHTMPKALLHHISRFLAARDIYFINASSMRVSFKTCATLWEVLQPIPNKAMCEKFSTVSAVSALCGVCADGKHVTLQAPVSARSSHF